MSEIITVGLDLAKNVFQVLYERLGEVGYFYAIRLPANSILREKIEHRPPQPAGRPSQTKVKRLYEDFQYQAASWYKQRLAIAKIEWHLGELFPRVGFIVTNQPMEPDWVVRFYNRRGTAEQHIKESKHSFHWTRPIMPGVPRQQGAAATARADLQSGYLLVRH